MSDTTSEPLAPVIDTERLVTSPKTYWQIVRAQFFHNKSAVFGLSIVMTLFVIAIFVPFLANSKPFYITQNGETSFPLFRGLTAVDYTIAAAVGCFFLLIAMVRRLPAHIGGWSFLVVALLFAIAVLMIQFTVKTTNDRTDYRELAAKPGTVALFTLVRYSPEETNLNDKRQAPGVLPGHYLGTDDLGRDVFSRLLWSARVSLAVGFVAQGFAVTIGVFLGAIAGYFGRRTDFVIMRLVEIMMCFPSFFLILTILAFFGRHLWLIMMVIGLVGWTENARFVRAEFLKLRTMDFTQAARALGLGPLRIAFRHILPNGIAPVMVNASFGVAAAILIEGGLSFLGFGVAPPTATWGTMLNDGRVNPLAMPWMIALPGLAIFLAVTGYNLVGEGLRDALDPKLKRA